MVPGLQLVHREDRMPLLEKETQSSKKLQTTVGSMLGRAFYVLYPLPFTRSPENASSSCLTVNHRLSCCRDSGNKDLEA